MVQINQYKVSIFEGMTHDSRKLCDSHLFPNAFYLIHYLESEGYSTVDSIAAMERCCREGESMIIRVVRKNNSYKRYTYYIMACPVMCDG